MQNNWLFPLDLDPNGGSLNMFPVEPLVSGHLLSHISSFVDNSLYNFRYMYVPGNLALQQAFSRLSKLAGTFLLCFASGSNINHRLPNNSHGSNPRSCRSSTRINCVSSVRHNLVGFDCNSSRRKGESNMPVIFGELSRFTIRQLCEEAGQFKFPVLSLAAALVPPFENVSRNVLAVPLADGDLVMQRCMGSEVEQQQGCGDFSFHNFNCARSAVEPRTGIEFPAILENMLAGGTNSSLMSEVLVGTGSRTMKIIKIKSLKVYAFGFYVHPNDVCEKLGPKYASIPASELNKHHNFYKDLLREDINMTVRLVVSCNGMKISTVRDAFEKSLRARLMKTNPDTDYDCLKTFGSLFSQDIPIRAGTTIYFRRTADGHLVTEIGGSHIGAVHSKDLCRAFFDMYIGDVPVCEQTKEEIGRNVANIIRRC